MKFPEYHNKRVTIFGLGSFGNGPAAIRFFSENGAHITVTDLKTEVELKDSLSKVSDIKNVRYVLGRNNEEDFMNAEFIFRSPAIPKENRLLEIAKANGAQILMAEAMLMKHFGTSKVIGITGTKGKTTTATLSYELLRGLGHKAVLAGVPEHSAVELLLNNAEVYDYIVLEMSSWDCEGLDELKISPHIAIITEIAEDHLNRYGGSMQKYALSKASIFKYQKPEDYFIVSKNNKYFDSYSTLCHSNQISYDINYKDFASSKLLGLHNKQNLTAALQISIVNNFDINKSIKILNSFKGVNGRIQNLGTFNAITFINDTCATAPIAAIASMQTFKDTKAVFIIGGYDKNLDYSEMAKYIIKNKVDYVMLSGTATNKLIEFGLDSTVCFDSLPMAFNTAISKIKNGGSVVLSPGAASFGMFLNEFDRGNQFNELVNKYKNEINGK